MKYVVFSDVHGNLEALEAVLNDASEQEAGFFLCLGDVIGYGANPNECVERIKNLPESVCLKGNHDAAVVDARERSFFHEVALEGIRFTEEAMSAENLVYLRDLPYTYTENTLFMGVHASPYRPEAWEYVLDHEGAQKAFRSMTHQLAFIGHSHAPVVFSNDGWADRLMPGAGLQLREGTKYIINVGSVGQPRDGNPDACYALFDDDAMVVELFRVSYDRKLAAEKILKAGLPAVLAERLLVGY